jgi:hypothetical protein
LKLRKWIYFPLTFYICYNLKMNTMKIYTVIIALFTFYFAVGQSQIGNADMELWENVGAPTEEPTNWNSFKTGSGSFAGFANKQIERSTSVRAGATGMYCARIWSTSVFGIVANGNMTLGQINLGSSTPANALNYNYTKSSDPNFSEACVNAPDSIVAWVKYTQAGAGAQQARISTILHDAYDLRDPIDAASQSHVIATAILNYNPTGGNWTRLSVPFTYVATPGLVPASVLVTFTTNSTPGGGAANDEVLVDDIQLIYNAGVGISTQNLFDFQVNYEENILSLFGDYLGDLQISNLNGSNVYAGKALSKMTISIPSGVYFATLTNTLGQTTTKKFVVR